MPSDLLSEPCRAYRARRGLIFTVSVLPPRTRPLILPTRTRFTSAEVEPLGTVVVMFVLGFAISVTSLPKSPAWVYGLTLSGRAE